LLLAIRMKTYQITENVKIDRELIKNIADSLAEEMVRKMYYKLLMLRFLPKIKAIEEGKLKALKGREIDKFFSQLLKSK